MVDAAGAGAGDPGLSLTRRLGRATAAIFAEMGAEGRGRVQRCERPEFGDFQCNDAMAAAAGLGCPQGQLADEIAARLSALPDIVGASVAGPGFVNIRVSDETLAARIEELGRDPALGGGRTPEPERIFIDFGGPNIAKPMHVGHLRSLIIGDCLQRLLRFRGHDVVSDVHLGDWGLQMGMLISEIERTSSSRAWFDPEATAPFPADCPVGLEEMALLYPRAAEASKRDPTRLRQARAATALLQEGHAGYQALWQRIRALSRRELERQFAALGVGFDRWGGESDAGDIIPEMIASLRERELVHEDGGAVVFPVARDDDAKDFPPLILLNARGASTYHATDLATIRERARMGAARVLYVVDQRQALHFEQLFRASQRAGYLEMTHLEHLGFGTVNGRDGKPFATRDGGVLQLEELLDVARKTAMRRLDEAGLSGGADAGEQQRVADMVAIAAIKFADLVNARRTGYVFDIDRFTALEGRTGPYLLYAAVRISSLLRRAREEGVEPGAVGVLASRERAVALALDGFADALDDAERARAPHLLCEHLFTLAQAYSAAYAAYPVLTEPDPVRRAAMLELARIVLSQLRTGLSLIGIEVPDRM